MTASRRNFLAGTAAALAAAPLAALAAPQAAGDDAELIALEKKWLAIAPALEELTTKHYAAQTPAIASMCDEGLSLDGNLPILFARIAANGFGDAEAAESERLVDGMVAIENRIRDLPAATAAGIAALILAVAMVIFTASEAGAEITTPPARVVHVIDGGTMALVAAGASPATRFCRKVSVSRGYLRPAVRWQTSSCCRNSSCTGSRRGRRIRFLRGDTGWTVGAPRGRRHSLAPKLAPNDPARCDSSRDGGRLTQPERRRKQHDLIRGDIRREGDPRF